MSLPRVVIERNLTQAMGRLFAWAIVAGSFIALRVDFTGSFFWQWWCNSAVLFSLCACFVNVIHFGVARGIRDGL